MTVFAWFRMSLKICDTYAELHLLGLYSHSIKLKYSGHGFHESISCDSCI